MNICHLVQWYTDNIPVKRWIATLHYHSYRGCKILHHWLDLLSALSPPFWPAWAWPKWSDPKIPQVRCKDAGNKEETSWIHDSSQTLCEILQHFHSTESRKSWFSEFNPYGITMRRLERIIQVSSFIAIHSHCWGYVGTIMSGPKKISWNDQLEVMAPCREHARLVGTGITIIIIIPVV